MKGSKFSTRRCPWGVYVNLENATVHHCLGPMLLMPPGFLAMERPVPSTWVPGDVRGSRSKLGSDPVEWSLLGHEQLMFSRSSCTPPHNASLSASFDTSDTKQDEQKWIGGSKWNRLRRGLGSIRSAGRSQLYFIYRWDGWEGLITRPGAENRAEGALSTGKGTREAGLPSKRSWIGPRRGAPGFRKPSTKDEQWVLAVVLHREAASPVGDICLCIYLKSILSKMTKWSFWYTDPWKVIRCTLPPHSTPHTHWIFLTGNLSLQVWSLLHAGLLRAQRKIALWKKVNKII